MSCPPAPRKPKAKKEKAEAAPEAALEPETAPIPEIETLPAPEPEVEAAPEPGVEDVPAPDAELKPLFDAATVNLPKVSELADFLAGVDLVADVETLRDRDTRKTAAPIYAARIEELS